MCLAIVLAKMGKNNRFSREALFKGDSESLRHAVALPSKLIGASSYFEIALSHGALSFVLFSAGGTGSYPPGCKGWQRIRRAIVILPPRHGPNRSIASIPYCEQVGVNRQTGGNRGEMNVR